MGTSDSGQEMRILLDEKSSPLIPRFETFLFHFPMNLRVSQCYVSIFFHPCQCSYDRLYFPQGGSCDVFHSSRSSRALTFMFPPSSLGGPLPRPRPAASSGGDAAWLQRLGLTKVSCSVLVSWDTHFGSPAATP